ncbi:penicillin-binding protein [Streptomyces sp. NBC_01218]|uniref:transglycosylase domain-containing protein n=1 Tax=unclassified Streptomyces TaxID=2593676 RepID=UPI0023B99A92|nr:MULTISPECIES: transglycosylase domain-containing protein [unclassified Streptomyces]WEH39918.1 transglycosylase domain-containing protein [Streptomyces sp. AM 2-1-1]WSQ51604.1 penicillin-binding protein [Streptomyces sp. NBC_01218]
MGRADERRARGREARVGKRGGIRGLFTWKRLLGTFFGLCLLVMGAFAVLYLYVPVPEANAQAQKQSNVFTYSDGTVLARTGEVNREIVDLAEVPKAVQHTFVAAENKSFYQDKGVDLKGTTRALLSTVSGKGKQGGSTITQQYVKNYYLTQDATVTRKLKELVISLKVDQKMSKDDILAGYINTAYYGRGASGIQAAAQAYYGVDASKLDVSQGAYLAATLQAPSQYDWATATPTGKRLVKDRWAYTLDNMVEKGWLSSADRQGLEFPVPKAPKPAPGMEGQTYYLVEAAKDELNKQGVTDEQLDAGGWTITLNIDKKRQKQLEKSVDDQLESKLDRKNNKVDATVQAGATSVDPKTGAVVALYGGVGLPDHYISNATRSDYQPASTFKPLVLASALENESTTQDGDLIGLNTTYDGTSKRPVVGSDTPFSPENEDDQDYGDISVQKALNSSVNSVFAQMVVDVGPGAVKKTALGLGLPDKNFPERPAITLGTMNASTWDMAGAYATLDHHGKKVTPFIVKSAKHRDRTVEAVNGVGKQVISRKSADTVTKAMTGVVDTGSGQAANTSAYEAAGKTGTSENNKAAWFAAYTPELTTVVALYGEDPKEGGGQVSLTGTANSGRANGGGFPARIWADYTLGALNGGSDAQFDLEDVEAGEVPYTPPPTPSASPSPTPSPSATTASPSPTPSEEPTETETPTPDPSQSTSAEPSESPSEEYDPGEDDGGGDDEQPGERPGSDGLLGG